MGISEELDIISKNDQPEEETFVKPVIGIIYPPPEVRNIVDKTASFVARNGPEFESRIRQNEVNNPKFNFLNSADPYHAYYQHKVKEFKEGRGQEPVVPKLPNFLAPSTKSAQEPIKINEPIVPKDPPAEFEFVVDPPSISAFDLDVVKLTAQFVARNGRQFLTNLMNREQRNYQFDFLRPQHSLFNYFTKLVEQYTKILIPPKDLLNKLRKEAENPRQILDEVKYRVEWAKFKERERQKEEEAIEKERIAYAQIDWHGFVVVETVDFQPNESGNLPPPTTPEEVGARILAQERFEKGEGGYAVEMEVESEDEDEDEESGSESDGEAKKSSAANTRAESQVQDMEEASDDEDAMSHEIKQPTPDPKELPKVTPNPALPPNPLMPPKPSMPPPPPPSEIPHPLPPLPPTPDQVIIKKDYNPKARAAASESSSDQFMISPITGEKIPSHKVQEHMRIGLLDPKWIEERNRSIAEKRNQEEVFAPGMAIESSLKQLAERRTDIFGSGAEETQIGKKIGEEEEVKDKKVVWDGHTASMEKVTQKARENISIEEQIAVIHKVKGLLPDEDKEKIGPSVPSVAPPPPPSKPQPPPPPPVQVQHRPSHQLLSPRPPMQMPPRGMMLLQPRPPPMQMNPVMGMARPPMAHMPPPMAPPMAMPPVPPRFPPNMPPRPPMQPPPMPGRDEPPQKKQKTEDSLIPEEEFLRRFKGNVMFKVSVPSVADKPEWKLGGQMLTFTLPLTDSVSVVKAKIHEAVGMPAGKQKLQYEGIFVKDSNTLAFYNFQNGAVVQLQMKERGGKRK